MMIGMKFNQLTVLKMLGTRRYAGRKRSIVLCKCDCGTEKALLMENLTNGNSKSCGCMAIKNSTRHGFNGTPEYKSWNMMKQRCCNVNCTRYKNYGGRGITICERWSSIENFIQDMGTRPSHKHSLLRRDNDGNYEPDNCYWGTDEDKRNNKTTTRYFEYNGERNSQAQWARIFGLKSPGQISRNISNGKTVEELFAYYEIKKLRKQKNKPYIFS